MTGTVQGVGFRPFVYLLARRHGLAGWVRNDGMGVVVEVEGEAAAVDRFGKGLREEGPPLARIGAVAEVSLPPAGEREFGILESPAAGERSAEIPPDLGVCAACERELLDPADRRHRYPFLNCTHCGPRFTIVEEVPYDRARTTMRAFPLCQECAREYMDPGDRRFHAEPVACPACGPALRWLGAGGVGEAAAGGEALRRAVDLLAGGGILALQGLGGFHLAVDAASGPAVALLRARKERPARPFALMSAALADVRRYAVAGAAEAALLASPRRPITLLRKLEGGPVDPGVAPGVAEHGVMLAYTPLHHLLFRSGRDFPALVMTSGNRRDEPIARTGEEALARLQGIADGFLLHDRPIHNRADDSIARVLAGGAVQLLRRARGYVPEAVPVDFPDRLFAAGAELKGCFCLTRGGRAHLSQHIGDLDEERAVLFYREALAKLSRLLDLTPEVAACDLHPDYASTRLAEAEAVRLGIPLIRIQHHEAHVGSVLAEHLWRGPALGVALDGTGLGHDGRIWGGEWFLAEGGRFERYAHLDSFPLPGGDGAVRQAWRVALGLLGRAGLGGTAPGSLAEVPAARREAVAAMIAAGASCPLASSLGRLFDAAAVLAGLGATAAHEADLAMRLEGAWPGPGEPYPFDLIWPGGGPGRIGLEPLVAAMARDAGDAPRLSARFHAAVAAMVLAVARRARAERGIATVALSGGVMQNRVLAEAVREGLGREGFTVLMNSLVPPSDGGLALGQAWLAARRREGL